MQDRQERKRLIHLLEAAMYNGTGPRPTPPPPEQGFTFDVFTECMLWTFLGALVLFAIIFFLHRMMPRSEDTGDDQSTRDKTSLAFAWKWSKYVYVNFFLGHWLAIVPFGPLFAWENDYVEDWQRATVVLNPLALIVGGLWIIGVRFVQPLIIRLARSLRGPPMQVHIYVPDSSSSSRKSNTAKWTRSTTHEFLAGEEPPSSAWIWSQRGS